MTTSEQWSQETKKIFNGILLYSFAGIAHGILDPIDSLMSMGKMFGASSGGGTISTLCYIALAGIIGGYVLTFLGLSGFKNILKTEDAASISKIRTAFVLALVGAAVSFIPLMGWVGGILNIIAFILMLMGYSALKKSATFPELARKGASLLFVAVILLIVGAILDFIPVAGGVLNGIFSIIAYIMTLLGWKKIVNAEE